MTLKKQQKTKSVFRLQTDFNLNHVTRNQDRQHRQLRPFYDDTPIYGEAKDVKPHTELITAMKIYIL